MKDTQGIIKSFVVKTFQAGAEGLRIDENTSFLDTGVVDSMRVLELVDFLENQFGITVEDSELVPENLDSIGSICRYLELKGISDSGS